MKKIQLILLFNILTINLIFAKEALVELKFYFFPAFISQSEFVFKFDKELEELKLVIEKPFFKLEELGFERIEDDSSAYVPLEKNQFLRFGQKVSEINFEKYKRAPHRFFDGISIQITKRFSSGRVEQLEFDCPSRDEYKIEYEILDSFFVLLDNVEFKGNQKNYVERLRDYFDFGLPIQKVNGELLEYRFWGSLRSNHKTELKQFFKNLPSNEPIIFDMRNCGGMGTMFYKYFRRQNRKKEIYYLLENKDSYPVNELGNCKVIFSKDEIE